MSLAETNLAPINVCCLRVNLFAGSKLTDNILFLPISEGASSHAEMARDSRCFAVRTFLVSLSVAVNRWGGEITCAKFAGRFFTRLRFDGGTNDT